MWRDETTLLDTAKAARLVIAFVQGMGKGNYQPLPSPPLKREGTVGR